MLVLKDVLSVTHPEKYLLGRGDIYGGHFSLYKGVSSASEAHSVATIRAYSSSKVVLLVVLFCLPFFRYPQNSFWDFVDFRIRF
jgi:zona occludens toxin (predicted ATPase)